MHSASISRVLTQVVFLSPHSLCGPSQSPKWLLTGKLIEDIIPKGLFWAAAHAQEKEGKHIGMASLAIPYPLTRQGTS